MMDSSGTLRLAAFDLDGTLLDSASSIVGNVLECWEACGFPVPEPDDVRRIIGLPWNESVEALLPGAGEKEFKQIRQYHEDVKNGIRTRTPRSQKLFPGVEDMVDEVERSGYLLAIITSRSGGRLESLLEENRILRRFVVLKTADDGPGKPNPDLMFQALKETGVDRQNAIMIGDTTFDMQMARSARTAALGVSWGVHDDHELREAGAQHVAENMIEILPSIQRLAGEPL